MSRSTLVLVLCLVGLLAGLGTFVYLRSQGEDTLAIEHEDATGTDETRGARRAAAGEGAALPDAAKRESRDAEVEPEGPAPDAGPTTVEEETTARRIRGRVRDANGTGLAGVDLFCEPAGTGLLDVLPSFVYAIGARHSDPRVRGRSDAEGRFVIPAPEGAQVVQVGAHHPEIGFGLRGGVRLEGEETEVEIVVQTGTVIFGEVRDRDGKPLPEVPIHVSASADGKRYSHVCAAATDAEGRYRTPPLPFVGFHPSINSLEGYESTWKDVKPLEGQREVRCDFTLTPARRLNGRIVDESGALVDFDEQARRIAGEEHARWRRTNGVQVYADYSDPDEDPNYLNLGHRSGKVDLARSTYEIGLDGPKLRWISLWVGRARVAKYEITTDQDERDLVVDLSALPALEPRRGLEVVLIDDASGDAVSDATIEISTGLGDPLAPWGHAQRSEGPHEGGRATLSDLRLGPATLAVSSPGRAASFSRLELREDGTPTSVTVRLRPATGRIRGRVVDAAGDPILGAAVRLLTEAGEVTSHPGRGLVRTDAEGRFEMRSVAPVPGLLSIESEPHAPALVPVDARPPGEDLVIRLAAGVLVKFKPTGASGPYGFRILDAKGRPLHDDAYVFTERWGSAWEFRVPAGEIIVEARCPGYRVSRRTLDARAGLEVEFPFEALPK
ncbi:MAG: carboxypeptidase-like regulatory domain-containing protein [Planctomycetota bacterium]